MEKLDILPTSRALGAVVRRRKEMGLSQAKLADMAGVDAKHLQTVEAGIRAADDPSNPTLHLLMRIVDVFGIEMSTLFLETEEERRSRR